MKFLAAGILGLFLLMTLSCAKKNKFIIPERKMVPVLVDIHIANEISSFRDLGDDGMAFDSVKTYGWVFEKHDITKAEFDSSMAFYAQKSDALNKIYDKVIASISKMEAELARAELEESKLTVIYKDNTIHRLPAEDSTGKIPFDVSLQGPGDYKLKTKVSILRTDQSVNPHITAYFWYDDGSESGVRDYFKPVRLRKSEGPVEYSVSKKLTDSRFTNLRGFILDHDNADTSFVKRALVIEISVLK